MLVNFRCSNFRSIKDEVELSSISGNTQNHEERIKRVGDTGILKLILLFGANGSGKSNVFKAIRFSRDLIINHPDAISSSVQPYTLDKSYVQKPSMFEYEILIDKRFFRYGFEAVLFEGCKIVSEWFEEIMAEGEDRVIFTRDGNRCTCEGYDETDTVRDNTLYLRERINREHRSEKNKFTKNTEEIKMVIDWFTNKLAVVKPSDSLRWDFDFDDPEKVRALGEVISKFDVGVGKIGFFEHMAGDEELQAEQNMRTSTAGTKTMRGKNSVFKRYEDGYTEVLRFEHGNNDVDLRAYDESDGTNRLFDLAPILVNDDKNVTYVVDELDRCLHPDVVYGFIEWFLKKKYKHDVQLITTTHQTMLMDQDIIRRDEIWFVEKDAEGSSTLFSGDDFSVRSDLKLEKAYREGRFGGKPNVNMGDN